MSSRFFRRRTPLPIGCEYELPHGQIATPAQSAEYRRRRRRVAVRSALFFLAFAGALWIGLAVIHTAVLRFGYEIAIAIIWGLLAAAFGSTFRCPVCGMPMEQLPAARVVDVSTERRAALYGKYKWCESCGTRFEPYPDATYPSDTDAVDSTERDYASKCGEREANTPDERITTSRAKTSE